MNAYTLLIVRARPVYFSRCKLNVKCLCSGVKKKRNKEIHRRARKKWSDGLIFNKIRNIYVFVACSKHKNNVYIYFMTTVIIDTDSKRTSFFARNDVVTIQSCRTSQKNHGKLFFDQYCIFFQFSM